MRRWTRKVRMEDPKSQRMDDVLEELGRRFAAVYEHKDASLIQVVFFPNDGIYEG